MLGEGAERRVSGTSWRDPGHFIRDLRDEGKHSGAPRENCVMVEDTMRTHTGLVFHGKGRSNADADKLASRRLRFPRGLVSIRRPGPCRSARLGASHGCTTTSVASTAYRHASLLVSAPPRPFQSRTPWSTRGNRGLAFTGTRFWDAQHGNARKTAPEQPALARARAACAPRLIEG